MPSQLTDTFPGRVLTVVGIVIPTLLLLLLVWLAADALLLVFASILLAVLFRTLSDALCAHTPVPRRWALGVTLLGLVLALTATIWLLSPAVADQVMRLRQVLPQGIRQLSQLLERYGWAQRLVQEAPGLEELLSGSGRMFSRVTGAFSSSIGVILNLWIIFVLSLFLASDPGLYREGLLKLFPIDRRARAREVLDELGRSLRAWLLGQLAAMVVIGVLVGIGLAALGIPLTLALAGLAMLFNFIPNFGPILAGVPGVLLALTQGFMPAVWVALLYVAAQNLEGNFITPMIQQRAVSLPPALTIAAQLALGLLFGLLGVALAVPLTVVAMVLVRMLYIEDVLGDRASI